MKKNVLVVGDVVLDEYVDYRVLAVKDVGDIHTEYGERTYAPGGCGNFLMNLKAYKDINVHYVGVLGCNIWDKVKDTLLYDPRHPIVHRVSLGEAIGPVKTRHCECWSGKVLFRVERGGPPAKSNEYISLLNDALRDYKKAGIKFDAAVISDYGYGACCPSVCKRVMKLKVPVYVDPITVNWGKFDGAYLIKADAYLYSRRLAVAKDELGMYSVENVLVTTGEHGCVLYQGDEEKPQKFPADKFKDTFVDATGAGDTLLASLVHDGVCGVELRQAIHNAQETVKKILPYAGTVSLSDLKTVKQKGKNGH